MNQNWTFQKTSSDQGLIYDEESGRNIAVTYNSEHAPVVAASLDLLRAAKALVSHIEELPDDTEKCRHLKLALNNRAGEELREAIAKAENA